MLPPCPCRGHGLRQDGQQISDGQQTDAAEEGSTLSLAPTSVLAGTTVTATGSGYWECEMDGDFELSWDDEELEGVKFTEYNVVGFSASFKVPASATPGPHVVASRCYDYTDDYADSARTLATATFTVPAPPEVTVLVPNLVGSPPEEASAVLQREGLALGQVSGSGDVVGSQEPAAGERVSSGRKVNIILVRMVAVPNLVNQTVNEARMTLAAVGLVLGNNPDGGGRVRSQTPTAGTVVARGTPITVTVSEVPVPPPPNGPTAGGPVPPPPSGPTAGRLVPPTEAPSTSLPTSSLPEPPPIDPPPSGFPWWVLLVVAVLILLGVLVGTFARLARKGPAWVRSHVRAVARFVPHIGVKVTERTELRVDRSSRTCAVRIVQYHDKGALALEVVS